MAGFIVFLSSYMQVMGGGYLGRYYDNDGIGMDDSNTAG